MSLVGAGSTTSKTLKERCSSASRRISRSGLIQGTTQSEQSMSMNEFRRLAAKIDQHMQQLSAQGVNDAPAIINRMMGYVPDLHKIWVGTSDDQLIALSNEFPGFYRYALIMEEASEAERNKPIAAL